MNLSLWFTTLLIDTFSITSDDGKGIAGLFGVLFMGLTFVLLSLIMTYIVMKVKGIK